MANRRTATRGGCFDALFARNGKDSEHEALVRRFEQGMEAAASEPPDLLDAEAILTAYEARYGMEAAVEERQYLGRMGTAALCRLHVLREALRSAAWVQNGYRMA
jgi:hypothetical protein